MIQLKMIKFNQQSLQKNKMKNLRNKLSNLMKMKMIYKIKMINRINLNQLIQFNLYIIKIIKKMIKLQIKKKKNKVLF